MAEKKCDQDFFLALAAKGKDEWNAWRRDPANNDVRATFAGIDFSEAPRDKINFEGFDFGDEADFSRCKWRRGIRRRVSVSPLGFACFTGAVFGARANFTGAAFDILASFKGAAFGYWARFDGAAFGNAASFTGAAYSTGASFNGAAFGDGASFNGAAFGDGASFKGAAFGTGASFTGAAFDILASFDGAVFGAGAIFEGAAFLYEARFKGAAFGRRTSFAGTIFKGGVEFKGKSEKQSSSDLEASVRGVGEGARVTLKKRHEDLWTRSGSGPDRFLTISFTNARFDGEAKFSGRSFEQAANFTNARFYYPPDFDNVTNASLVDFTGAFIGFARPGRPNWTFQSRVAIQLRALRKIAEETKNHDLERDLYIEERKAERGVHLVQRFLDWVKDPKKKWAFIAHILWILVMSVYWALADYGRSFIRPFAWLVSSGFFFYWRYTEILAQLMAKAPDIENYKQAVRMVALGNAVPFVGPLTIDSDIKKFLFCLHDKDCLPIPPEGYQLLVVGQNLISITCVFFIGLALRNYFRIK
jgi:Pentapeptide repeats (9 copies)